MRPSVILQRAFEQVKLASQHDYEHLGKVEVDADLGPLLEWPEFKDAVPRLAHPPGGQLMASVTVTGLDALEGETAFAFFVVRLRQPTARDGVVELLRYVAPLIPDADAFIDELPDDLEDEIRILGMPWLPPEAGHAVDAQRRLIEARATVGVEAAWFFQTGTSLPIR